MENTINIEIKKGITLHLVKTNKFKTNLLSVFLTTPLSKEKITKNAMIPAVLRRGSKKYQTQEEISIALEEMYGASFDCGIDKIGDDQILKFYLETINSDFIPEENNILEDAINLLLEVVFNPNVENNKFVKQYVDGEKVKLKQIIEGKKDSKATYAYERCIEEMYKNKPYGLYKYGRVEDLEDINEENLYLQYKSLIENCKIDIFISGEINENIKELIIKNENIKRLNDRNPNFIINNIEGRKKERTEENIVKESMDISQGKLIIGMDVLNEEKDDRYIALIYNAILGGTPTSKMFQNVREKNSLAYTASSSFLKQKANIFIKCGIEIENFDKALEIIKQQIEDMKKGDFSEKNIEDAKTNIISTINQIPEEQDTELVYIYSQELSGEKINYDEYINLIQKVKKEEIVNFANKIQINTIYFLKN